MITSAEEFVRLRTSEIKEEYDRAAHEDAPDEVWLEVIERYPDMRVSVAYNKTIPDSIIEILSNDPDDRVRWFIAQKRKTPPAILEKLARDADAGIRNTVAINRKTPAYILEMLLNDEWDQVVENARAGLARIAEKERKK
jgi:hypothetical protein